jgi:hypothetical protein
MPAAPAAAASASAAPSASAPSPPPDVPPQTFYDAFLAATDVGGRFQSLAEPNAARNLREHYRNGPTPAGLDWVADARWSDPHGYERLWRVEESKWSFADEESASRFVASVVDDLHQHVSADTEGPSFGSDCHVLTGTVDRTAVPSTHFVYVFRVARLVTRMWFTQGPRARAPLTEDLVVPIARRAAEKAAAAQGVALDAAR